MFYYSEIDIYEMAEGSTNDMGIYHPGEEKFLRTIPCDVQPYSRDRLYRDYGFDEEVKYRLFCDPNPDVKTGNIVKYKGSYYTIVRIIAWDDYYIAVINDAA